MPVRVIPVLDVQAGTAVRAVGGDRTHYRPLSSTLHPGSDPLVVARAYRDRLGLRELYLADLDAIAGARPNLKLYKALSGLGMAVWVDPGVHDARTIDPLIASGVAGVVAGLETLRGPEALAGVLDRAGADRLVFSLDLRRGVPIVAEGAHWGTSDPEAIARVAIRQGVRRVLLLDLSRVGRGEGIGTWSLLEQLAAGDPRAELIVGGGISGFSDLATLERAGASAVLIASALHDGRIGTRELGLL